MDAEDPSTQTTVDLSKPSEAGERRQAVRHPCRPGLARCLLIQRPGDLWPAEVRDISANGLSLVVLRRFDPGVEVLVELGNKKQKFWRRLKVRIVHARLNQAGGWVLGGAFERELSDRELRPLI